MFGLIFKIYNILYFLILNKRVPEGLFFGVTRGHFICKCFNYPIYGGRRYEESCYGYCAGWIEKKYHCGN